MKFTIFYASATGHSETIASTINELIPDSQVKNIDDISSTGQLAEAEALICCIPTWNTGSDTARSGTSWDKHIENIPNIDFTGKLVAIIGLGDSIAFSKYFCDAMEELYTAFITSGAKLIGSVPIDDYIFDSSKSVIDGEFCGLPLDVDNESDKTLQRINAWYNSIMSSLPGKIQ